MKKRGAAKGVTAGAERQKVSQRLPKPFPIVGIGASAGGLEAFLELLKYLPTETGMGFVFVQHLDPQHESALTTLLARATTMPVREVKNGLMVEPNCVYVIAPNVQMTIAGGVLTLSQRSKVRGAARSIDHFFESLAGDLRECAVGVVLSGTATDGTVGLQAIKAEGGVTFAQDTTAKYDSMPRSAISAGCVDFVLSPERIATELAQIAKHPLVAGLHPPERAKKGPASRPADLTPNPPPEPALGDGESFGKILLLLRNHCGVDFSLYKSSTIRRRVMRRLVLNKQTTLANYAALLKGNTQELDALYSDALINVTTFFRNPDGFELLKRKVFPKLLAQHGRDDPVRIWALGCSTGQEAYSLIMAFAEVTADYSRGPRLQLFATDLSEATLEKARAGHYPKSLVQDVSPERLRRFFVEEKDGYRVNKSVRDQVVFARQNVISDPPFSRIDLITCRNLLIYLEPELQRKIIPAFHYALKPDGFLFLGASESISQFPELFAVVDKTQKIFSKKSVPTPAFRLPLPNSSGRHRDSGLLKFKTQPDQKSAADGTRGDSNVQREADRVTINAFGPPSVLVDAGGQILQFRGSTGAYLEPPSGKVTTDLLKMVRKGLMLPLRAALSEAKRKNKPAQREGSRPREGGGTCPVLLQVTPLRNLEEMCFLVFFTEVPKGRGAASRAQPSLPMQAGRREAANRVAELERELAETRDYLQSIQEQNEAATEELQASHEEVQSTNEELQSMNEELETSKEELESTNEELTTINDEMVSRNAQLGVANSDLGNLQVSLQTAILLLGRDLTVRRFTTPAENIFNLVAADIGRGFGGLRHHLDFPGLERLLEEVVDTVSVRERDVQDRTGHWYALRARPYLTVDNKVDGVVLVLTDIDGLKRSEQEAKMARDDAASVVKTMPLPYLILSADLRVQSASDIFYRDFKTTPSDTEGRLVYELGNAQWNIPALRKLLEEILPSKRVINAFEVTHVFPDLGSRTMLLNARQVDGAQGTPNRIVVTIEDITARHHAQEALRESNERTINIFESITDACYTLDKEWRFTYLNPKAEELLRPVEKTAKTLLGKSIWQEFPDTVGTIVEETYRRVLATRVKAEFELHYPPIGLWLEVRAYPSKEGISVYFQDISERQRVKAELRESEARFRNMADHSPMMLCLTDASGACTYLNERWFEFTGQTAEKGLGAGWLDAVHPDDWPSREATFRAAKSEGRAYQAEYRLRRKDGTYRWALCAGSPRFSDRGDFLGYIASVVDIQERKEAEEALRKSRERFDIVKDAAQVGFWFCDLPFDVLVWDHRVKEHFWLSPNASVTIETFYEQIHPDDRERTRAGIAASISEKTRYDIEYRTVDRATRAEKWIRAIGRTFYDTDGRPIRFDGVTLDITERRRGEEALRDAKEQAELASRAKDDFLAALSHELRTPLSPVLMTATALREDLRLPADVRDQLGMVERNIALEARLIDDLLDLTAVSRNKLQLQVEPCEAHALIELAIEIVRAEADRKEITVARAFDAKNGTLRADPARFQQVIWNLLRNAVKFTPRRGKILIGTSNDKKADGTSWLRIEVADSGIGIEPAMLERIFLPFEQGVGGAHRFGGLGLGLSIARAVMTLHGGHITAYSKGPNRGCTFVAEFPGGGATAGESTGRSTPCPRDQAITNAAPRRILLVEDHESSLHTLSKMLERDGHSVVTAMTVAEALDAATSQPFDLVISDLGLPDGSGLDLMQQLRDRHGLRGIALSGYGMDEDLKRSHAAGFLTHLVKPTSIAEIRRVLASLRPA